MYNGIGLATTRGSGTNGHIQRNLSTLRSRPGTKFDASSPKSSELIGKNPAEPNADLLRHERRRRVELRCVEFEAELAEEKNAWTAEEIAAKVDALRARLLAELAQDDRPRLLGEFH